MELDPNMKSFHFACFHCRKMVRKILLRSRYRGVKDKRDILNCAECGSQLAFVGRYFEPPRLHNLKAWKQLELQYTHPGNWFTPYDGIVELALPNTMPSCRIKSWSRGSSKTKDAD